MDQKETPELLSRLNEIVERARLKRDKKILTNDRLRAHQRSSTGRDIGVSDRR